MIKHYLGLTFATLFLVFTMMPETAEAQRANGQACSNDNHCASNYCADGRRCAPRDGTGQPGAYCHHDNHCAAQRCNCTHGLFGFCKDWESWNGNIDPRRGFCEDVAQPNGSDCRKNEECASNHCANGRVCAPQDNRGRTGDYCHHNNHCRSSCFCPGGNDQSWGFCSNYENFSQRERLSLNATRQGFVCR